MREVSWWSTGWNSIEKERPHMRRSNNINQIAKRLNESGRTYDTDLTEILEKQKQLWGLANEVLMKLSAIR